jgi:putative transposase
MVRALRRFTEGESVHVYNRGNDRMAIFHEDVDRQSFIGIVRRAFKKNRVAAHSFTLMSTHYHIIVTPPAEGALPSAMKEIGERYVRFYNRKYERTGTLWESRYRGRSITDEQYALICSRYIEQNPVRAGMVATVDAYPWSSYRFLGLGHPTDWLTPHPTYLALGSTDEERRAAYHAICAEPLPHDDLIDLRDR